MGLCGMDLDDVFAYQTAKTVSVRHKWLGIIYYSTIIAIVGYTIGYKVLYMKGYEMEIELAGAVRASVQQPSVLPPVADLPYCSQSHGSLPYGVPTLPCVYPDLSDGALSRLTPGEEGSLLVGTRVSKTLQTFNHNCTASNYSCAPWEDAGPKESFYLGGLEACTIMVQHLVSQATTQTFHSAVIDSFSPSRPVAQLKGPLGQVPLRERSVTKGPSGDIFNISDLLWVAGADADEPVANPSGASPANGSLRYNGVTLRVRVVYSGSSLAWTDTHYEYRISVNELEAKFVSVDEAAGGPAGTRTVQDLHGLQLLFSQDGNLNVFDFQTLMLSLVAGFAYLFVAKMAADYFLLYFAPKRHDYKLFVQAHSPDFSPESEGGRQLLEGVLKRKRRKHAHIMGMGANGGSNRASSLEPLAAASAFASETGGEAPI